MILPQYFIDAETGLALDEDLSLERHVLIKPQFTEKEFAELVEKFATAAKVGVAVTLTEIMLIFAAKKLIFSMWILVLTL